MAESDADKNQQLLAQQAAVTSATVARAKLLDPVHWPTDYKVYALCGLGIVGMLALASYHRWNQIAFDPKASIPTILSSMLVVSLFVERIIEVFVSVWVDRDSASHEQNLDYWQATQGRLNKEIQALIAERDGPPPTVDDARKAKINELLVTRHDEIDAAVVYADTEEKALLPFQARTLKVSTWVGLVIGVITSAAGFRFLSQLVVLPADAAFRDSGQFEVFVAADILLTGAVLAGGSKLVHQIFSVYSSFMSTTSKSLADQSKA